jgi:hypothetical protein
MIWTAKRLASVLAIATVACSQPTLASPDEQLAFAFSQIGYAEGATVTGTFSGVDSDGNGILVHFPQEGGGPPIHHLELTAFSMHFSGNSRAPAFDLTLDDLFGFVFDVDTSGIGDDPAFDPTLGQDLIEGIGAIGAVNYYTSGLGPNGMIGGFVGQQVDLNDMQDFDVVALDSSESLVLVTRVPEPTTAWMLLAGMLGLSVRRCLPSRGARLSDGWP